MKFGHERLDVYIVSMLTKLGRREYRVGEEAEVYGDYDNDHDNEYLKK